MIIELIVLITMVFAFIISFVYTKDILHPSCILSGVYVIDIAFYIFMRIITKSTYALSIWTLYFSLGLFVFFLGSLIGGRFKKFKIKEIVDNEKKELTLVYKVLIILQVIGLILFIRDVVIYADVEVPSIISYMTATRSYKYNEKMIFMILRNVSFVLSFVGLYEIFSKNLNKNNIIFIIIQVAVSIIYMSFMTTRTVWFLFLIPVAMLFLLTHYYSTKSIIKYFLITFLIFFIFTLLVTFSRKQSVSLRELRCYLCSGMIQFTEWLKDQGDRLYGQYTFRAFLKILKRLGLYNGELHWVDQRYLKIPSLDWHIGNVFSFYHGYAQDFGLIYAMFIQLVVGVFHGFIYFMARAKEKTLWVILYALYTNPLVLQFFSDQYAANLSLWIQMTIIALLICLTNIFYKRINEY